MSTAWMERANCIGIDPEAFFPDRGGRIPTTVRQACATCPVQAECLEYAIAEDLLGYWGGLSERQRRRILKPKRRTDVCVNGHPWTEETLYVGSNGRRRCRKCRAAATKAYRERQPSNVA